MTSKSVLDVLLSGILSILGALASYGVAVAVNYLKDKKEALIKQVGIQTYNHQYDRAKQLYFNIEKDFKLIPKSGDLKKQEFDKKLLKIFPELTQDRINYFREGICGEIDAQLAKSQLLAPAYDSSKDNSDVSINKADDSIIVIPVNKGVAPNTEAKPVYIDPQNIGNKDPNAIQ